jgi:hypothetical protein
MTEVGRPRTFDDLLAAKESPEATKTAAAALHQAIAVAALRAPAELTADYATLGASYDRFYALLAKSGWKVDDMVQAMADPMSTTAVSYGKIDTAASDQAAARIDTYNQKACAPKA